MKNSKGVNNENGNNTILWDFEIQTDHEILTRRLDAVLIKKKKLTCHLEDFVVQVDHRVIIKESEKLNKYKLEN